MPSTRRSDSSIVTTDGADWLNRTGNKFTKLISNTTCVRLCSLYVDEQVEYEIRQEDGATTMDRMMSVVSSVGAASFMGPSRKAIGGGNATGGGLEVEMYKQFLFDEESVMTSLSERDDEDQEDEEHMALSRYNSVPPYRRPPSSRTAPLSPHRQLESVRSHEEDHRTIVTQRTH